MTGRERVQCALRRQEPDCVPISDNLWTDTLARFRREGMPADISAADFFDFDITDLSMDISPRLEPAILGEDDETTTIRDRYGYVVRKFTGRDRGMEWIDHPVKTRDDWKRIRERLVVDVDGAARLDTESYFLRQTAFPSWEVAKQRFEARYATGRYLYISTYGPNEAAWRLRGWGRLMMDVAEYPDWVAEMYETFASLIIDTVAHALRIGIRPDGLFLADDLGSTRALMYSPEFYRETLWPQHRRIGAFLKENDLDYFMHTDGNVSEIIPDFIEAGVDVLQPLEAKAGLDVHELKTRYPQLALMGNIDMRVANGSLDEIEQEVASKVAFAKRGGGYIYHSDHSVPSEVSLANYQYLLAAVRRHGAGTVS